MPQVEVGGLLKNPLGATSAFATKKVDQGLGKLQDLYKDKEKEILDKLGIPLDKLEELEKHAVKAKNLASKMKNYGAESIADFAGRAANVQSFMQRTGMNNCDLAGSIFGFANKAGKFLCDQLGIECSNIDGMISKVKSYVDLAKQGVDVLEQVINRAQAFIGEFNDFVNNIGEKISQLGKDIIHGIESELKAYAKLMQDNATAHLAKMIGGFLSNKCIAGVTDAIVTEAGRAASKRMKL